MANKVHQDVPDSSATGSGQQYSAKRRDEDRGLSTVVLSYNVPILHIDIRKQTKPKNYKVLPNAMSKIEFAKAI